MLTPYLLHTEFSIDLNQPDWLLPESCKTPVQQVLRELYAPTNLLCTGLSAMFIRNRSLCKSARCINPMHYRVVYRQNKKSYWINTLELVDYIDWFTLSVMGVDDYLYFFNSRQESESLRITKKQLEDAIKIKAVRQNT